MKGRGFLRRVVLPALWLLIGVAIAASLVKLAFLGGTASADDDPLTPTGSVPSETVTAGTDTIENVLAVDGTIELDPAKSVLADKDGELIHAFVDAGEVVKKGDRLFQIRSETTPEPSGKKDAPPPEPVRSYTDVYAPVSGKVSSFAVDVGDPITKDAAIASVQPDTFKAVGTITPLDRYRLIDRPDKARVSIKGGPKPFTCRTLTIGDAASATQDAPENGGDGMAPGAGPDAGGSQAASQVTCRVPRRVTVFDGLNMSMEINAGTAKDVLVLPVTAVRGLLTTGTVWVLGDDGIQSQRAVTLGVTDGKVIEVGSGLKAGDTVLRYVPGSASEPGQPEQMQMEGGPASGTAGEGTVMLR